MRRYVHETATSRTHAEYKQKKWLKGNVRIQEMSRGTVRYNRIKT